MGFFGTERRELGVILVLFIILVVISCSICDN